MKIRISTRRHKLWLATLSLLWAVTFAVGTPAENVDASGELAGILAGTSSLQGLFDQRQYDDKGNLLSESSGRFGLLRPGYFFWHIESPDSQSIIATPEYLWHHDLDLETVTRRPVTDSSAMSPLQILGADLNVLALHFEVEKENATTFSLSPLDAESAFENLTLTLVGNNISQLQIVDALSQRIDIRFKDVSETPVLAIENFVFTPPAGVDLFYYDD